MNMEKLDCPACGGEMTRAIQDLRYVYKGQPLIISGLDALVCTACGEALFATPEDGARYDAAIRAHITAVNLNNAPDLRAIRKRLKLTQAEAGRIFGGGVTAFSRYERGEIKPPVALVKFLQVLDRHPELLAELR
jgi:HTH-type transcriptional regulator / antitoxin MqsA